MITHKSHIWIHLPGTYFVTMPVSTVLCLNVLKYNSEHKLFTLTVERPLWVFFLKRTHTHTQVPMTIPIYEANHRNFTLAFTFLHSDISLPVEFHNLNLTETTGLGLELRSKKWYKQTHAPHDSWVCVCVCVCLTSFLTQATLCALNSSSLVLLLFKSQASSRGKST